MRTDTQDLVSVSQAARSFGRIVTEVAEGGRIRVVIKNSVPAVAIVPMDTMDRLSRFEELEEDVRMLAIATVRSLADSGARHDLTGVAAEFGIDLEDET